MVGAQAMFPKKRAQLDRRGHLVGRLSVDVAVGSPVDQRSVRSGHYPSVTLIRTPQMTAYWHWTGNLPIYELGAGTRETITLSFKGTNVSTARP